MWLWCRVYRLQLDAFLDGRLAPRARQRLACHLDHCPACDRVYNLRRDLRRELTQAVPLVGRDHAPDFDRMWQAVRAELPRPVSRQMPFRYGLVMLLVVVALLVPFTLGHHDGARPIPNQPVPQLEQATRTPDRSGPVAQMTAVASVTLDSSQAALPPTLPEPDKHS